MSTLSKFGDLSSPQLLLLGRVSEASERYEDMTQFMSALLKKRCKVEQKISVEERNLFSVAFKNVVGQKRSSWRILNEDNDEIEITKDNEIVIQMYKTCIQKEVQLKCLDVVSLLEKYVLPHYQDNKDEDQVFYLKMAGDYYRYLAELAVEEEDENGSLVFPQKAYKMYAKAMDVARNTVCETHPTRLGLSLNFSVCYYEILKEPQKACDLAKEAFDGAIAKLDSLNDASYKDSTLIMQLLRDNLTLWTSQMQTNSKYDHEDTDD
eukprot:66316_1